MFHCSLCTNTQQFFITKESILCDPRYSRESHGGYLRYSPIGSYPDMTLYFNEVGVMAQLFLRPIVAAELLGSIIQISLFYELFGILFYYYSLAPDRNK